MVLKCCLLCHNIIGAEFFWVLGVLLLTKEFASLENQIDLVGAFLGLGKAVLMNLFTMHSRPLISVDSSWINAWHAFSSALI